MEEAPILVVAPHSTLLVGLVSSPIMSSGKIYELQIPVLEESAAYCQSGSRDDQEAKNKTVEILKAKMTREGWPQL